jgi:hypothetical protein
VFQPPQGCVLPLHHRHHLWFNNGGYSDVKEPASNNGTLHHIAVPQSHAGLFWHPRQESNLLFNLRRVACESATLRGQLRKQERGGNFRCHPVRENLTCWVALRICCRLISDKLSLKRESRKLTGEGPILHHTPQLFQHPIFASIIYSTNNVKYPDPNSVANTHHSQTSSN